MDLHKKLSVFHYFHSIALILLLTFAATFGALSFYNAKAKYEKESLEVKIGDIFKDSWGYEQTNVD